MISEKVDYFILKSKVWFFANPESLIHIYDTLTHINDHFLPSILNCNFEQIWTHSLLILGWWFFLSSIDNVLLHQVDDDGVFKSLLFRLGRKKLKFFSFFHFLDCYVFIWLVQIFQTSMQVEESRKIKSHTWLMISQHTMMVMMMVLRWWWCT